MSSTKMLMTASHRQRRRRRVTRSRSRKWIEDRPLPDCYCPLRESCCCYCCYSTGRRRGKRKRRREKTPPKERWHLLPRGRLSFSLDDSTRCLSFSVEEWRYFRANDCLESNRRGKCRSDERRRKSKSGEPKRASRVVEEEEEEGDDGD